MTGLNPKLLAQRAFAMGHLVGFALFLGGTLTVAILFWASQHESRGILREYALGMAVLLQNLVVLPGAVVTVLSGVLLSAVGPWGFVRYRWMVAKLVGTAILAIHSQASFRPLTAQLRDMAHLATELGQLPVDYADLSVHFQRVALIQIIVLLVLGGLGVFKPGGKRRAAAARNETRQTA